MTAEIDELKILSQVGNLENILSEGIPISPSEWKVEVINPHSPEGLDHLKSVLHECAEKKWPISTLPFRSGRDEVLAMSRGYERSGIDESQAVEEVTRRILTATNGIPEDSVRRIISHGTLMDDRSLLVGESQRLLKEPSLIEDNSRWILDPLKRRLDMYLGPEEHRMLSISRLLGLVPFETISQLREMKIRVIGASVAASTIDLLVALGAEDLKFIDYGNLDPAKLSQMPSGMGDFRNSGIPKVAALMEIVQGRNPYGKFEGIPGRALLKGEEAVSQYDIYIDEWTKDADLVPEVVDNGVTKLGVRFLDKPILYVADLGSNPIAGIEDPEKGNWFNQSLSQADKDRMSGIISTRDSRETVRSVYLMVNNNLPNDHRLEFLLATLGAVPYWSQTPISAKESSALATKLVLQMLQGKDAMGKNIHPKDSPKTLVEPFDKEEVKVLNQILNQIFQV